MAINGVVKAEDMLSSFTTGNFGDLVKKNIIITDKPKIANAFLEYLVEQYKNMGIEEKTIIKMILHIDKFAEEGKINKKFFDDMEDEDTRKKILDYLS